MKDVDESPSHPSFLYTCEQQSIMYKVRSGTVISLHDALVIVDDANIMKLNFPQGINPDTKEFELDRNLVSNYIKNKYGDPIYFIGRTGCKQLLKV